jgi:hypothetical protein
MTITTQTAKIHRFDAAKTNSSSQKAPFFARFWHKITQEIGTGCCKPGNYDSMSQKQLEERAAEDIAIAKTLGF